jgi:hypothetical protein
MLSTQLLTSGKRTVTTNLGATPLAANEALVYKLFASGANPIWAFGCADRLLVSVSNHPLPVYTWYLAQNPAPAPDGPVYTLDRPLNAQDVYVVALSFAAVVQYRLLVVKQPGNLTIQDITYNSFDAHDAYREPLDVSAI